MIDVLELKLNKEELRTAIRESIENYYSAIKEYKVDYLLEQLNENRGIIDNLEGLIKSICGYLNNVVKDERFLRHTFVERNEKERYCLYRMTVPQDNLNMDGIDFMVNPIFNILLFQSDNNLSDLSRELGETFYVAHSEPDIKNVGGKERVIEPEFQISINTNHDFSFSETQLAKKIRHEVTHCKANLFEFLSNKERLEKKIAGKNLINGISDNSEITRIIKRCFYLIDPDEINARAHQIYSELDETNKNLFLKTLKSKIVRCGVYQMIINEFDNYINILSYNVNNPWLNELLNNKFNIRKKKPAYYLLKKLIFYKNKQIMQFQKVGEKWLYDLERNI